MMLPKFRFNYSIVLGIAWTVALSGMEKTNENTANVNTTTQTTQEQKKQPKAVQFKESHTIAIDKLSLQEKFSTLIHRGESFIGEDDLVTQDKEKSVDYSAALVRARLDIIKSIRRQLGYAQLFRTFETITSMLETLQSSTNFLHDSKQVLEFAIGYAKPFATMSDNELLAIRFAQLEEHYDEMLFLHQKALCATSIKELPRQLQNFSNFIAMLNKDLSRAIPAEIRNKSANVLAAYNNIVRQYFLTIDTVITQEDTQVTPVFIKNTQEVIKSIKNTFNVFAQHITTLSADEENTQTQSEEQKEK